MTSSADKLANEIERIKKGGAEKYHIRNREQKKLFARDRLKLLLDDGKIEFEDGMFAECLNPELPSDGNITGVGRIHGRPVAFSASDSTVKAGSAGEKSVQKNLRIQEMAMQMRIPMFYLIDSAGARITDQIRLFRAGAPSTTRSRCRGWCLKYPLCSGLLQQELPIRLLLPI